MAFTPCSEIFKKHKEKSVLENGIMFYWIKEGITNTLKSLPIKFNDQDESLELMRECEVLPGFMFWATSPEGDKFYKDHYKEINYSYYHDVMKPWMGQNMKTENDQLDNNSKT